MQLVGFIQRVLALVFTILAKQIAFVICQLHCLSKRSPEGNSCWFS